MFHLVLKLQQKCHRMITWFTNRVWKMNGFFDWSDFVLDKTENLFKLNLKYWIQLFQHFSLDETCRDERQLYSSLIAEAVEFKANDWDRKSTVRVGKTMSVMAIRTHSAVDFLLWAVHMCHSTYHSLRLCSSGENYVLRKLNLTLSQTSNQKLCLLRKTSSLKYFYVVE